MDSVIGTAFVEEGIRCEYKKAHLKRERTNRILCHPYAELIVVRQGDIIHTARGETRRLGDKCIIYNREGMQHNQFVQEHRLYERYMVCFKAEELCTTAEEKRLLARILDTPMVKELEDGDFDLIFELCRDICDLTAAAETDGLAAMRRRHDLILTLLRASAANDRQEKHEESYIARVVEYLYRHLSEDLRIEEIAAAFFVSKSKLTYDFRSYCNMSIREYITVERIEKAKELLENGYMVSATAEALGFSSASYFIKVFTALTGTTPLQWQLQRASSSVRSETHPL